MGKEVTCGYMKKQYPAIWLCKQFQGVTDNIYAIERYRAVRPIIEYKAGIEKYNFGKDIS